VSSSKDESSFSIFSQGDHTFAGYTSIYYWNYYHHVFLIENYRNIIDGYFFLLFFGWK